MKILIKCTYVKYIEVKSVKGGFWKVNGKESVECSTFAKAMVDTVNFEF